MENVCWATCPAYSVMKCRLLSRQLLEERRGLLFFMKGVSDMSIKRWCGRSCADCLNPCALDASISCWPDCENLNPDGTRNTAACEGCDASPEKKLAEIVLPIHPEHCYNIATGKKTLEIRKRRHCPTPPFKAYVYCTKADVHCQTICGSMVINTDEFYRLPDGTLRHDWSGELMAFPSGSWGKDNFLNKKVIGEFICKRMIVHSALPDYSFTKQELDHICVSRERLEEYGAGKQLSGLIIEGFKLYDHPLMLADFGLTRPPQSWCYTKNK